MTNSRLVRQQRSPPSSSPHRWGQRIEKHPGVLKRVTRQGVSRLKVGSGWRRELEGTGECEERNQAGAGGGRYSVHCLLGWLRPGGAGRGGISTLLFLECLFRQLRTREQEKDKEKISNFLWLSVYLHHGH